MMNRRTHSKRPWWRPYRLGIHAFIVLLLAGVFFTHSRLTATASELIEVGYRDFSYGTTGNATPTGEKPESKLWWNDGSWWGSLRNANGKHYIYRMDLGSQSWVDTGILLDNRPYSKADTLWDNANQKLYVASHVYVDNGLPTSTEAQWGRLYRYSYNAANKTYSLDAGFPVNVTRGKSETLVVDKDSTGQLWVTYVESGKVMVNRSLDNDLTWGEPFVLPASTGSVTVDTDDISSVVAFQGNKIGVMWSNQLTSKMYFAVHLDGDPDNIWQPEQTALPGPNCTGACADDHINLKSLQADGSGRVYAAIKTSHTAASAPLIMLLVRDLNGNWNSHVFGRNSDDHTRPIVLLDEEHGRIYMFATAPEGGGVIYVKSTPMNNINFPLGLGDPFIKSATDLTINNATSTKQNLNSATGLLLLASDRQTKYYVHNYIDLSGGAVPTPTATATPVTPTPTNTPAPGPTATPTHTPVPPTATPAAGNDVIYVSTSGGSKIGSLSFADEDILAYDTATGAWSIYFDGSDVGLGSTDVNAFALMPDQSILLSFDSATVTLPGPGTVEDRDIVRFIPTSTGSNTAGSFQIYFDGSDVGLDNSGEDIDAIAFTAAGKLIISTTGSFAVPGVSGKDEDMLEFTVTSLGTNTAGSWAMYFDGSDVGLAESASEDIAGAWIDSANGDIYLTALGAFSVSGLTGDGTDVFICHPSSLGPTTACTFGPGFYWRGSASGLGKPIDGLEVVR